jgi:hypothetical protein
MPETPEITWKRLTVEEVKQHFIDERALFNENTPDVERKLAFSYALERLIKEEKITAWKKPNGEVLFSHKPESIRGVL